MSLMINVVGLYLPLQGKFLVAQRAYGHMEGMWEFPGGKIERGEGLFDAIKREILEELSITVNPLSTVSRFTYNYPIEPVTLTLIKCELVPMVQTVALTGSHTAYAWIDVNETDKPFAPLDQKIMEYLRKHIKAKQL